MGKKYIFIIGGGAAAGTRSARTELVQLFSEPKLSETPSA